MPLPVPTQVLCSTAVNTQPIVLFSQNYLPMARINLRKAAVLLVTHRAEPLDIADHEGGQNRSQIWQMRSPSLVLTIPEHIRLIVGGNDRVWKVLPVNRREVLRRDHHTCQYCGSKKQLTLDHVIPRSKGGLHSWDNVVTACAPCNSRKGARSLKAANMRLKRLPKAPINPIVVFAEQFWKEHKT